MTKKQRELYDFICSSIKKRGYSPTIQEMTQYMHVSSPATIHEHLQNLVDQRYLQKNGYRQGYEPLIHICECRVLGVCMRQDTHNCNHPRKQIKILNLPQDTATAVPTG